MSQKFPFGDIATLGTAPPEMSYPGLSPQLLARTRQLWSVRGLDFDDAWRRAIRQMPGFRALPRIDDTATSAQVDLVFLFDQGLIWVKAIHAAARRGYDHGVPGLDPAQWHGLAALSARLTEQMTALRMLALTDLPLPAMQIARSVSEDVDMLLVLLVRRKLAARFIACRTVEEASSFWRRHIAGGRAFRALTEKLYEIGLDYSPDTDYGRWRKDVLANLGAAVHSNALAMPGTDRQPGVHLGNDNSLHFATFRIHELCAYAQLIKPDLVEALTRAATEPPESDPQAGLAAPLSAIVVNQIQSLSQPAPAPSAGGATRH
ncbi:MULTISPECIES: hypothetical protein [Mameliella]|uniref:Uncharacterized protein n=1 Tax=Mameliella alba TaxID=561184 RepID=A0A0B3RH18_9RHOB|nr:MULTISPECIES: hypothetical protein [Mameliella]KHQ50595.1 hypothetical protein OA50_04815 [Mameliella alba]MBY6122371.1 hypothetical protein [Mameliella alba]MDD9731440.1 hypothetical protein [Mameliella sp. AT18]ODM47253.1 hypothetical protein A9320_23355 [Ruegeria sp. PBVC088]